MIDFNRAARRCLPGPQTSWLRRACGLFLALLLVGCSPDHNWRRVSVADGAVVAMLPAKPHEADRNLVFEGYDIHFTLASARVGEIMYTVGVAPIPPDLKADSAARERFFDQTRASLYRNLGNTPPPQSDADLRYVITGEVNEVAVQAHVMAWMTPDMLIEGIVLGEPENILPEQIEEFFRELAPGQQP